MPRSREGAALLIVLTTFWTTGCEINAPAGGIEHLEFAAEAAVEDDAVQFTLFVRNTAPDDTELTGGGCLRAAALLAYEGLPDSGLLRWDERSWVAGGPCFDSGFSITVPGHQQVPISRTVLIESILGDSLPEGPYHLVVVPDFDQDLAHRQVSIGDVVLAR